MKLLSVFMAVLVVFTGFNFCKDDECVDGQEKTELSQVGQEKHDSTKDVCAPFCHCSGCPFSVLLPKKQRHLLSYKAVQKPFPASSTGDPIWISPSIWQPPKLA